MKAIIVEVDRTKFFRSIPTSRIKVVIKLFDFFANIHFVEKMTLIAA